MARNAATDRVLLFSDGGPTVNFFRPSPPALLNGRLAPDTLQLPPGVPTRLRIINIRTDYLMTIALLEGDTLAAWTPVAKDGADLPSRQAYGRPAELTLAPGEVWDVMVTPTAGPLRLRYGVPGSRAAPVIAAVEVH